MRTDYSQLRGVNYVPATTQMRDYFQALLTPRRVPRTSSTAPLFYPNGSRPPFGQFDAALVLEELKFLRALGFDSIRFFGSFTGWLVDRPDYLRNLQTIVRHCDCLGLRITFIVWNGITLPEWSFAAIQLLLLASQSTWTVEQAIQTKSDDLHSGRYNTRRVPLRGTHFEAGAWGDPDPLLRSRSGGFLPWTGVFVVLDQEARRRLPIRGGLGEAADLYLRDIASVFDGEQAFLSYDLTNEPWTDPSGRLLQSALDLITSTYDVLSSAHSRSRPDFTVGLASPDNLVPLYNALRTSGRPMTYASFHDYSPRMYSDASFYRDLLRDQGRIGGLPLVCSEFYSPYLNPPNHPWGHPRGRLGEIARNLAANRIGGQMWNVLEQNFFFAPLKNTAVGELRSFLPTDVQPSDGLFVPVDPPWGFQWPGRQRQLTLLGRTWREYRNDVRDLLQFWTVTPSRSLVSPPVC